MANTRDQQLRPSNAFSANSIKLASSASEQNVYFTYVCLVNDIKPSGNFSPEYGNMTDASSALKEDEMAEDRPIQVERSKALHELAESYKKAELDEQTGEQSAVTYTQYPTTTSDEEKVLFDDDESNFLPCANPNVLELTKMRWLTENPDDGLDSSSASVSPNSSSSNCSQASEYELKNGLDDKYLSTILRLDKEHNMFGLSNIAIVGAKPSKVKRKDDEKAVFHQTAIVQICYSPSCCRNRSNTNMPSSLKCGGCRGCGVDPNCYSCVVPCERPICCSRPCSRVFSPCRPTNKCAVDCNNCFGLQIKLNRKPVFEEPKVELTPRSSCILDKPIVARACTHQPECIPPSLGFPYLMPCYWPARPSAPCSSPARCFHNPPCLPARKPTRVSVPTQYKCPKKCEKCENDTCPGHNPVFKKIFESKFTEKPKSKTPKEEAAITPEEAAANKPEESADHKPEATAAKKPETEVAKKPEPAEAKKPEPAGAKKPEAAGAKKPEPAGAKKPEAAGAKKPEPAGAKKPEAAEAKKPEAAGAKKPEPTKTKKTESKK